MHNLEVMFDGILKRSRDANDVTLDSGVNFRFVTYCI